LDVCVVVIEVVHLVERGVAPWGSVVCSLFTVNVDSSPSERRGISRDYDLFTRVLFSSVLSESVVHQQYIVHLFDGHSSSFESSVVEKRTVFNSGISSFGNQDTAPLSSSQIGEVGIVDLKLFVDADEVESILVFTGKEDVSLLFAASKYSVVDQVIGILNSDHA
jgi:hypothetical protein